MRASNPTEAVFKPRRGQLVATLGLLAALALGLSGCASTDTPPTASAATRSALAPTGTLRVGVYLGSPTSLVRTAAGEERGVAVELGRELARQLGVPVQLVTHTRVPEIIESIKAGRVDVTITNASPARAREVDFSPTVLSLESGYLVPPGSPLKDASEVDRSGHRVGVTQGSTSQGQLPQLLKQAAVMAAPSVPAAVQMLRDGQLQAFATNKGILFEMSDQLPGSRVLPGRWSLEHLALAVPKGRNAEAMTWLQGYVQRASASGLVREAAARAGLRGLAPADAR